MFRSLFTLSVVMVTLPGQVSALQQDQAREAEPNPSVFRSSSRLVTTDVVVTNHQGNPVLGLGKDDFQVFDDDRKQKIAVFSPRDNTGGYSGSKVLTTGEYTNSLFTKGPADRGATILLFDTINSAYLAQAYSLGKIRAFLRQLKPEDHIGIYVLNEEGLKVVHEPSQPALGLIQALQYYDAPRTNRESSIGPFGTRSTALSDLDRFLRGKEDHRPMRPCDPRRLPLTVSAFQEITRSISYLGGRKTIIWVTEHALSFYGQKNALDFARGRFCGMEASAPDLVLEQSDDVTSGTVQAGKSVTTISNHHIPSTAPVRDGTLSENDELDMLLRLLTQSNIILYPVSAEGLQTVRLFGNGGMDSTGSRPNDPGEMTESVLGSVDRAANIEAHQQMQEMAHLSGGRAFYNRNDLETGIRRALDDSKCGYEIAYYPDFDKWNGDWHNIRVTVNRPGVTVLARGGYYAFPQAKLLPPKARKQMLEEIAASPLEDIEIPLTVRMTPFPAGEASPTVEARVLLSAQKLFNNQMGTDHWKSDFEVLFFQLTAKNAVLDVTTQHLDLDMDQVKHAEAVKRGINTVEKLTLKPGASLLCVIVHDRNTDAVGSVRIPLEQYAAVRP